MINTTISLFESSLIGEDMSNHLSKNAITIKSIANVKKNDMFKVVTKTVCNKLNITRNIISTAMQIPINLKNIFEKKIVSYDKLIDCVFLSLLI